MQAPAPVQDLDRLPVPVFEVDEHGVVVDANALAAGLVGQAVGTLAGIGLASMGDPALVDGVRAAFAARTAGDPFPATMRGPSGPVPVSVQVGPVGTGPLPTALVTLRDLRLQRQERRDLRKSHAALRAVLDNEPECVKRVDAGCRLLDMNPAGLGIIGAATLDLVAGLDLRSLVLPTHRELFAHTVAAAFRGERTLVEFELTALDGTRRWMEQHAAPLWDPEDPTRVQCMLAVTRDITRRKRDEAELLRKQRIEAIGELAGGIAHDLNNVLAPIALSLEDLRPVVPAAQQADLDALEQGLRHGAEMLRQLLTFARGADGERLPVSPDTVVRDLARLLDATLPKSVAVRIDSRAEGLLRADATQLHQVLLNLCLNARDAMPRGGTLRIRTADVDVAAPTGVGAEACQPGRYVLLQVEDEGVGIPPEAFGSIFEPFFTTKAPDVGTGLGLSSSLGIVRSHDGFLQVHSELGEGTRFSVFLPVDPDARGGAPAPAAPPAAPRRRASGERVLLVEDDATVRRITGRLLRASGLDVVVAEDGVAALAAADEADAAPDLLFTDLHMPRMDGIELAIRLRVHHPDLPIIIATGRLDDHARRRLRKLRGVVVLEKPFAPSELRNAVGAALKL